MVSTFLLFTAISASGDEEIKLAVSPAQSLAPANLNIRARIVPNAANRFLEIVADSGEFYRSSEISLEGDRAPATTMFEFRGLPGGEYLVYGILIDKYGHRRAMADQQVRVIAAFGE
jgi:hypothetical protein